MTMASGDVEEFFLEVFPGDFDLPSLDQECLLVLLYCGLANIPVKVVTRANVLMKKVPTLRTKTGPIQGASRIVDYFEQNRPKNDLVNCSAEHRLDVKSYSALVENKLDPCFQYLFWFDDDNYNEFLRGWYALQLPFPTNFFIPRMMRNEAINRMEASIPSKIMECDTKNYQLQSHLISEAQYCLDLLDNKLGSNRFFFGKTPTRFDATLISYLALLFKVPVKNDSIKRHIQLKSSLQLYIDRGLLTVTGTKSAPTCPKSVFDCDQGSSIPWKTVFTSGLFAAFAMLLYAASNGIIEGLHDYEDDFQPGDSIDDDDTVPEEEEEYEEG